LIFTAVLIINHLFLCITASWNHLKVMEKLQICIKKFCEFRLRYQKWREPPCHGIHSPFHIWRKNVFSAWLKFLSLNWQFSAFSHNLTLLITSRDQHQQLQWDARISSILAIFLFIGDVTQLLPSIVSRLQN